MVAFRNRKRIGGIADVENNTKDSHMNVLKEKRNDKSAINKNNAWALGRKQH